MTTPAEALTHCLDLVERGETDIGTCLAPYRQWESELRPLLALAIAIRSLAGEAHITPEHVQRIKERILGSMAEAEQPGAHSGLCDSTADGSEA